MIVGRFLLLLIAIVTIISACTEAGKHEEKTVFKYNEPAGITSLDPAFSSRTENIWAVNQLFNGLVQLDQQLNIKPCIAKSWSISRDGTLYTFNLRTDVFFHRSSLFKTNKKRKVIAADFVYSFNRLLNPETASPGVWVMNAVKKTSAGFAIKAPNDSTLTVELNQAYRPFLSILSMPYCSVVPHEIIAIYGKDFRNHPVGTGPFYFKYWAEGEKLILLKNDDYFEFDHGKRLPYLDAVNIHFLKDRQTAFLEFIKGNFDFMSGIDGSFKDELLTKKGKLQSKYQKRLIMSKIPFLKTDYLGFNIDAEDDALASLSDEQKRNLRLAINYAIDRNKMMLYLRNNIGKAANRGFIPKGIPDFDESLVGYSYNPSKSAELLRDAGFNKSNQPPIIKLITTSAYLDVCEYIQHELDKAGIGTSLEVLLPAVNSEMIAQNKAVFFRKSWVADYADKENFMSVFYSKNFSPNGPNYTHFKDAVFDSLYASCLNNLPVAELNSNYKKMEEILLREAPVVPLYYDDAVFFYHHNIIGLRGNGLNLLQLKTVKKQSSHEKF